MSLPVVDPSVFLDSAGLTTLKSEAAANAPGALRAAAQQFEALFTGMVLKAAQQANFKDPLFGSDQQSFYQDLYDQQLALEISKGPGLGLADMLVQQLRREGVGGSAPTPSSAPQPKAGASAAAASPPDAAPRADSNPTGAVSAAPGAIAGSSTASAACAPGSAEQVRFARALWPAAQQAARELGVSPMSLIAQAALETGWGQSVPRDAGGRTSHNLFGIKTGASWSGPSVTHLTQEYQDGAVVGVSAQFRSYGSAGQCFQDYVALLRGSPRYAGALGTGSNVRAFGAALQQGGYATDPAYAAKLSAVAESLVRALGRSPGAAPSAAPAAAAGSLKLASALPTTDGSDAL